MLELLYSTGIRAGELLGLEVAHLDLKNSTAMVTGKGNKQRIVPIGKTALRYTQNYLTAVRPFMQRDKTEQALFLNADGKRLAYQALRRLIHRYAKDANIKINTTPHTFRRSCTTELLRANANMYHVKELLGHESLDTLKHYARLTINDLRATHKKCHPREKG
jgi:site-specific recombinase XerD